MNTLLILAGVIIVLILLHIYISYVFYKSENNNCIANCGNMVESVFLPLLDEQNRDKLHSNIELNNNEKLYINEIVGKESMTVSPSKIMEYENVPKYYATIPVPPQLNDRSKFVMSNRD